MAVLEHNYNTFLKLDLSEYVDKWIAIIDGEIVAASNSFKKTYEEAKKQHPKKQPFISKVPGNKAMIL